MSIGRTSRTATPPVSTTAWTPGEYAAFTALLDDVLAGAETSSDRVTLALRLLADAQQAHEPWVDSVYRDLVRDGATRLVRAWAQRARVVVPRKSGRTAVRPAVRAIQRVDDEGGTYIQQDLLVAYTWDELRFKREQIVRVMRTYGDDLALIDALNALQDKAPGARTPEDALRALGMTLSEWLGRAA